MKQEFDKKLKKIFVQTLVLGLVLIGVAVFMAAHTQQIEMKYETTGLSMIIIGAVLYLFGKAD